MTKHCLGLLLVTWVGAIAADVNQLDIKPGEWETTMVSQGAGASVAAAMPPEVLALPPEQRAKMEAALKQASRPTTTVTRRCITKDDLSKMLDLGANSQASCKATVLSSSRTKQETRAVCSSEKGASSTANILVEAQNSENIKITLDISTSVNGRAAKVTSTGTSKWVSATCTEKK